MQYPANSLIELASQYHESDYNRLKFGPKGSPVQYKPLSICLPERFEQLRLRQVRSEHIAAWWPCPSQYAVAATTVPTFGPAGAQESDDLVALQSQILLAMTEPISRSQTLSHALAVKTSVSHPLNISSMIPAELISFISSHLLLSSAPTFFSIPQPFSLDQLLTTKDHSSRNYPELLDSNLIPKRTNTSLHIFGALYEEQPTNVSQRGIIKVVKHVSQSCLSDALDTLVNGDVPSRTFPICRDARTQVLTYPTRREATSSDIAQTRLIGNLFLSSCPGKKVRLDRPANARSGICRDIIADLKRIKDLGVGCIICCLDDEELSFLGLPWSTYQSSARNLGIDISRVPTPEGLAPLNPASLDEVLMVVIRNYTLYGIPVLVHCRGGVGRAGVIACCWLIKLGICGWFQRRIDKAAHSADNNQSPHLVVTGSGEHSQEVLQYVGRVIGIVRARRSTKAVETYEQVKFLVEYVEYLSQVR